MPSAPRDIKRLARLMDSSIPVPFIQKRIGIDGLLGLIPGVGDGIGVLASTYIVARAVHMGAPRALLVQMAVNVGIDALVGAVPFVGDLFDMAWKSNVRNIQLLERHLAEPMEQHRRSRVFAVAVIGGLALAALLIVLIGVRILHNMPWT
jgi:hypothetical protein